jgi:hypothetical protein
VVSPSQFKRRWTERFQDIRRQKCCTVKRKRNFERGSTGNIRISIRIKTRGLKGNSGGKPQEDSKEILQKFSKAERNRPTARTPARHHDSRASEAGWR